MSYRTYDALPGVLPAASSGRDRNSLDVVLQAQIVCKQLFMEETGTNAPFVL